MTEVIDVKPEETTPPPQPVKEQKVIETDKNLVLAPKNQIELNWFLEKNASVFPACFKTKEEKLAAYGLGRALLGDKWPLAVSNMCYIKGRLTIYGEVPGACAQATGQMFYKDVFVINKEYQKICIENKNLSDEPFSGVCVMQRGSNGAKAQFYYTINEAEQAGQYPPKKQDGSVNHDSPWLKHTKIMLMRKAMNQAVKFLFPDAAVGVPVAEYDHDVAPDLEDFRDVTPRGNKAEELNKKILEQEVVQ